MRAVAVCPFSVSFLSQLCGKKCFKIARTYCAEEPEHF